MTYQIIREVYKSFEDNVIKSSYFEAESDEMALLKVLMNCGYGYYDENGRCLGEEEFIMPDYDTLLLKLYKENGDGMDYIFSIYNVSNNYSVFTCDALDRDEDDMEENW